MTSASELEERHLTAEMDLLNDLDHEKKACLVRLRHMEAYCHHSQTPPRSPESEQSQLNSTDELPTRKVTDKDFNQLAQQYRLRDSMDNLHASKIKVLRERQARVHQNSVTKMEKDLANLIEEQGKELEYSEKTFEQEEHALASALEDRKGRLQRRWKLKEEIERKKLEIESGVSLGPLHEVDFPG